jgi:hypothetical protein
MKKIKRFTVLVCIVGLTFGIFSCTKENSDDVAFSTYKMSDVDRLKNEFADILMSNEYLVYVRDLKQMAENIKKGLNPPLNNRDDFRGWIVSNLGETSFSSVNDAMLIFDNLKNSSENYYRKYNSFLEEVI